MIRSLTKLDIPRCVEICNLNFIQLNYSYDVEKELNTQFQSNFVTPEYYVYEEDNIIKGLGGLSSVGFSKSIYGLFTCYVDPKFHYKGIGKALTEFRINRIRELNGYIIFSITRQVWHLERFGFVIIPSPYKTWYLLQKDIHSS